MKLVYQNELIDESQLCLDFNNRGFLYGDGFFETILFSNGEAPYLKQHFNRIDKAIHTFGYTKPIFFNTEQINELIAQLCQENKLEKARIKLIVWRQSGGLYTPQGNELNYLITSSPLVIPPDSKSNVGIFHTPIVSPNPLSSFKTLSALNYVFASSHNKKMGTSDLVLLNQHSLVAECLYSNIFIIKNNTFYTPPIESGCIAGVMRSIIIDYLQKKNINICSEAISIEFLRNADSVFCSNALNIQEINSIESTVYKSNELVMKMREELLRKYLQ